MLLGVDIGGTKIAAGVVDSDTGAVLHSDRTATLAHEGGSEVLTRAIALAKTVAETANVSVSAVGIGAGGQIDYRSGVVLSATDILPGWAGTRLAEAFAEALHIPAFADNDVNAFALGEHRFGAGRGTDDCVYLALGTGVGGAIFISGKLHRGKRGTGGELGHLLFSEAELDGGQLYTFEHHTNGARLAELYEYQKHVQARKGGVWHRAQLTEPITGVAVGQAAKQTPQSDAGEAVRALGRDLGIGLASLANVLDTQAFVIGGGVSELGDLLLDPARETFQQHVLPIYRDTAILRAELGTNSSIVGAACVALASQERNPL